MHWFRVHLRLLLVAAWLALGAQGLVAFEAAWHHHDDASDGDQDSCAVCAAVAEKNRPVNTPAPVLVPERCEVLPVLGAARPAHRFVLPQLSSRGPPSTAAV